MADSQNSFQTPGFNSGDVAMDKNAGAKGDDGNVSVEKMEDIIFTWLCEADDLGTYTQRIVRDKMEKHLNLPAKSLKRDEALKQATENVCYYTPYIVCNSYYMSMTTLYTYTGSRKIRAIE